MDEVSARQPSALAEDVAAAIAALIGFVFALVLAAHVAAQHWGPLLAFAACLLTMAGTAIFIARIWRRLRGGRW